MHFLSALLLFLTSLAHAATLTLSLPAHLPPLPPSTRAILTTLGQSYTAPLTRKNTFDFRNLTQSGPYLLSVACRDYNIQGLRVDVISRGTIGQGDDRVEVWSVKKDGGKGERVFAGEDGRVELRVMGTREFYEGREGCELPNPSSVLGILGAPDTRKEKLMLIAHSQPNESPQKPHDLDGRCRIRPRVWDAISHGQQYVSPPFPSPIAPHSFLFPLQSTQKVELIQDASGPRNEKRIRRGAEEEPLEFSSDRPKPAEQL